MFELRFVKNNLKALLDQSKSALTLCGQFRKTFQFLNEKKMGNHRKFVFVCNGSDCKKEGCKKLQSGVKKLIGSDAHKGKYKIIKTKCMDFCKSAPVVIYEGKVLKKTKVEDVEKAISH